MTDELKMSLRECLPGYMVPTNVVFLDSWPLTPNGKVDVKALPAPGETDERKEIVPPATEAERIVTGIWSETLNIPESQISTQVSFFELNGNSLMAMRLLFRVNRTFNLKIELRNIYKYHTVKSLALLIDQRKSLLSIAEDVDCLDDSEVEEITL
jgi:acyl carrier protein